MDLLRTGMVTDKRVATPMPGYLGTKAKKLTIKGVTDVVYHRV